MLGNELFPHRREEDEEKEVCRVDAVTKCVADADIENVSVSYGVTITLNTQNPSYGVDGLLLVKTAHTLEHAHHTDSRKSKSES